MLLMANIQNGHHENVIGGFTKEQVSKSKITIALQLKVYLDSIIPLHVDCLLHPDKMDGMALKQPGMERLWRVVESRFYRCFSTLRNKFRFLFIV